MEGRHAGTGEIRLYDAAAKGEIQTLRNLLQEDPFLLDRVSQAYSTKTPLHVAVMRGHVDFVKQVLNHNSELAEELDSKQSTPLHIAAAKGYVEIVKELLSVVPDTSLARDRDGRNPLHLAAIKGQTQIVTELIQTTPLAAREKLEHGQTVLHLCVKHNQLETLKVLVPVLKDLVDAKDSDGNTILHLAAKQNQVEAIHYLVEHTNIDITAKDANGDSAAGILQKSSMAVSNSTIEILTQTKSSSSTNNNTPQGKWLNKKRDSIMVVAVLIATMAFQAGVNPPGGVWQDDFLVDSSGNPVSNPHRGGEAVMAYNHPKAYKNFIRANTVAFTSSLSTILLLISGLPFRRRFFLWSLMVNMWLTVTSVAVTYAISTVVVTPKKDKRSLSQVIEIAITVWCSVIAILLIGNTVRLIDLWLKRRGTSVWQKCRNLVSINPENTIQDTV